MREMIIRQMREVATSFEQRQKTSMVLQPDNRAEERAVLLCIQHTAICSGKRGRRKQCHYQGAYAYRQPAEQKRIETVAVPHSEKRVLQYGKGTATHHSHR